MRRDAKGPRLWLREDRRDARGHITHRAEWIIRDGQRQVGTRCGAADRQGAEAALAAYITAKHRPARSLRDPGAIPVADVLAVFLEERGAAQARPGELGGRVERLLGYFGEMMLGDITGQTCRAYVSHRGKPAAARRELEDLRAAIRHHHAEGYAATETKIVLPPKPQARERWLTRGEAARLLWAAWRMTEKQHGRGTGRRTGQHVARFILIGLYTGSRAGAICEAAVRPGGGRGYVDVGAGLFRRREEGSLETAKRRPPAALSGRVQAHIRRWIEKQIAVRCVVEWRGQPVGRVTRGFRSAVKAAGLETTGPRKVTPHTLRHTAATWGMQSGADPWKLAGMLGMSLDMLLQNYGHFHPEIGRDAAEAIARRRA